MDSSGGYMGASFQQSAIKRLNHYPEKLVAIGLDIDPRTTTTETTCSQLCSTNRPLAHGGRTQLGTMMLDDDEESDR